MKKITFYHRLIFVLLLLSGVSAIAFGQTADDSGLTIDRIFNSDDFAAKRIGALRWLKSGNAFARIEPSTSVKGGSDLVTYALKN
jgi:hypothetical protein